MIELVCGLKSAAKNFAEIRTLREQGESWEDVFVRPVVKFFDVQHVVGFGIRITTKGDMDFDQWCNT